MCIILMEHIQILSVVMEEEFIDAFHHGKEEKAYFPITRNKDGFSEDIRKFLIEHEHGRRIANMLRRELNALIEHDVATAKVLVLDLNGTIAAKRTCCKIFEIVCDL